MRAFFIEASGSVWQTIARQLRDTHGWNAVYWSGAAVDGTAVTAQFPGIVHHAGVDAALGRPAPDCADWPQPALDEPLLRALAADEVIALHMMDRMDASGHAFGHDERRRHYHDLLRYWLAVIERLRPEVVVFSIAPHIVYDYVLYALCRHLGIRTLMFERLGLPGWVYLADRIDGRPLGFETAPAAVATGPFRDYLDTTASGGSAAVPANFQKKIKRYGLDRSGIGKVLFSASHEILRMLYLLKRFGLAPMDQSYLKLAGRTPADSRLTAPVATRLRLDAIARKKRLAADLDRLASRPVEGEPFVLVALHYQPERATVPMAGLLGDQTLIVDMIAKALPAGWKVYVKEHPWQLQAQSRGEMQRSADFYRRLAAHPAVRLLPPDEDTSALIGRARAVATATGSVGWQAVCRGVPVLVFGAAWYAGCPGTHAVRSAEDCARVLKASDAAVPVTDVAAFLGRVQACCIPGILEPGVENVALEPDAVAPAMAGLLDRWAR